MKEAVTIKPGQPVSYTGPFKFLSAIKRSFRELGHASSPEWIWHHYLTGDKQAMPSYAVTSKFVLGNVPSMSQIWYYSQRVYLCIAVHYLAHSCFRLCYLCPVHG